MGSGQDALRLAIDAGATSSKYSLYQRGKDPVEVGVFRGLNYTESGAEGVRAFSKSVREIADKFPNLRYIGAAVAGIGRPDIRPRALENFSAAFAEFRIAADLYLFHDGEAALWAGLGKGTGVIVSAGTGSIAFGRTPDGREIRCGGWGSIAGDEGSAYWIARQGLSYVLKAHDGRRPPTMMSPLFVRACGIASADELVSWLHRRGRSKEDIAGLSRLVSQASEGGDQAATEIMGCASVELAELAAAALRSFSASGPWEIALCGSIFRELTRVRGEVKRRIEAEFPGASVTDAAFDPREGAALLLDDAINGGRVPDVSAP